jgi:hypothetical protein
MRAKRPDLDDVIAEFEEWRSTPHKRRIPERLWRSAIALVDRHAPSTISRHLRLSPARFKEMRAALGAVTVEAASTPKRRRRRAARGRKALAKAPGRAGVFAELVPASGVVPTVARVEMASVGGYRLVLESARGIIAVSTPTTEDRALVEAMRQAMHGVLRGVVE